MTTTVTIKNDANPHFTTHVATVSKDGHDNKCTSFPVVTLEPGEEKDFTIHSHQELRVYETDK